MTTSCDTCPSQDEVTRLCRGRRVHQRASRRGQGVKYRDIGNQVPRRDPRGRTRAGVVFETTALPLHLAAPIRCSSPSIVGSARIQPPAANVTTFKHGDGFAALE